MAHYLQLYLNQGHYKGTRLISAQTLALMHQPWHEGLYGQEGYGLGWAVKHWLGLQIYEHQGVSGAFSAMMALVPEAGYGVTILSNVNTLPGFQHDLMAAVLNLLLNQAPRPYWPTELSLRLTALLALSLVWLRFGCHLKRWRRHGLALNPRPDLKTLLRSSLEMGLVVGGLIYIKNWFGVPFNLIPIAAQPDLGLALILGAGVSLITSFLTLIMPAGLHFQKASLQNEKGNDNI